MKRLFVILFLGIALTGCATTQPIQQEKLDSISRVSAVSLMGNELNLIFGGITILTKKWLKSDATNWHIDDFVQEAIRKAIVAEGRHRYVDIDLDTDTMMKVYVSREVDPCSAPKYDFSLIRDKIRHIRSEYGIDMLIFVLESGPPCFDWQGPLVVGYGVYQETIFGLQHTETHASSRVIALDASNLEELSSHLVASFESIDNRYQKSGFESLTPEEKRLMEHSIKVQLWGNIVTALKDMGLIMQQ